MLSQRLALTRTQALSDTAWQLREEAANTLGKLAVPTALLSLIQALDDAYWQVRLQATRALAKLKNRQASPTIGDLLQHPISNLRKEAALALGEIADPASLVLLEAAATDADPEVRKAVRIALNQLTLGSQTMIPSQSRQQGQLPPVALQSSAMIPSQIRQQDQLQQLWLQWPDGRQYGLSYPQLRRHCPCGQCRQLPPDRSLSAEMISLQRLQAQGYGLQLIFADGHDRGIYPWAYLEQLQLGHQPEARSP